MISKVIASFVFFLLAINMAFSQPDKPKNGKVTGIIRDEKDNQPIAGATVSAEKIRKSISTSISGDYVLTLPAGNYTLTITAIGYETKKISDVSITPDGQFDLNVSLKPGKAQTMGEVVVSSSAKKETTRSLLQAQKNNASMTDGISAELIGRLPDLNTAQVLKRVSGVIVQNEKFVTIRGVSDRYNNVLINGSSLPSTEPNRRNFSFDLVPSPLVDNVIVNKSATPDLPGEFTGGIVQIQTKDIPSKSFIDIALGTGINTASINQDFINFKRDEKASVCRVDKEKFWYGPGRAFDPEKYITALVNNDQDYQRAVAVQIPNRWQNFRYGYSPVQNYQISGGHAVRMDKGRSFGVVAAATYLNEQFYEEGEARSLQNFDSYSRRNKYVTSIGGILNAGFKTAKHKFGWKNLYNNKYNQQFDQKDGYNINYSQNEKRQADVVISSKMFQTRLEGEHLISSKKIKLDWFGDFVKFDRDQPDSRFLLSTDPIGFNYNLNDRNINFGGIFSSILQETRKNAAANLSVPFTIKEEKQLFKLGYSYSVRNADYSATTLRILTPNLNAINLAGYVPYYQFVTTSNFENGNLYYTPTYANTASTGDKYEGQQDLSCFYGMVDLRLLKKLRVTGGIRNERNLMKVKTVFYEQVDNPPALRVVDSTKTYDERDWLPSVNLIYSLNNKINLRGSFSKTLARPDFIERSPYIYFDFPEQLAVVGTSALEVTKIKNYDFRFEYYPTGGEIFSFSLFYKDFQNPVERFFVLGNPSNSVEYRNLYSATAKGFEIDIRKSLAFINESSELWKYITLSGNYSNLNGEIAYQVFKSPTTGLDTIPYISSAKRPIQGLAPYILNAGISYQRPGWGINTAINRSGRKIVNGGINPSLVQYENPRTILDLQLNGKILKEKMEIRFNINDILNQDYIIYSNNVNKDATGGYPLEEANNDPKGDKFNPELDFINYKVKKGTNFYLNVIYHF